MPRDYNTLSLEEAHALPDGLTYTFKQRPNVKFHNIAPVNGRVMNIEDWRTSMPHMQTVACAGHAQAQRLRQIVGPRLSRPEEY